MVSIKLGNLAPLQEAKLSMQIIMKAGVEMGSYKFRLPVDFYPDYSQMGAKLEQNYDFSFEMMI